MSLIEMLHFYSHLPRQITNRNPLSNGLAKKRGGRSEGLRVLSKGSKKEVSW